MSNQTISATVLYEKLNTLRELDALEFIYDEKNEQLFIPYMMNDAVEFYYILSQCQIQGKLVGRIPADASIEPVSSHSNRHALIIRMTGNSIFTIWFAQCTQELHYYQYHRIGHFWVKGQEHWRRLVYIIGTIHEKYTFLGEASCNDTERSLLPLVEFPAFRYWSPIHDSLDHYYRSSREGYLCMLHFAKEAGDSSLARMLTLYGHLPSFLRNSKGCTRFIANQLTKEKHLPFYKYIDSLIDRASLSYEIRDYGAEHNETIEKIRTQFAEQLYADGYTGIYPIFQKNGLTVKAMEEHPFTILESDTFKFRIQPMKEF